MNNKLLLQLNKLRDKLHTGTDMEVGNSYLSRWLYFYKYGEKGPDCPYAKKAAEIFTEKDLPEIVELIIQINALLPNGK